MTNMTPEQIAAELANEFTVRYHRRSTAEPLGMLRLIPPEIEVAIAATLTAYAARVREDAFALGRRAGLEEAARLVDQRHYYGLAELIRQMKGATP